MSLKDQKIFMLMPGLPSLVDQVNTCSGLIFFFFYSAGYRFEILHQLYFYGCVEIPNLYSTSYENCARMMKQSRHTFVRCKGAGGETVRGCFCFHGN